MAELIEELRHALPAHANTRVASSPVRGRARRAARTVASTVVSMVLPPVAIFATRERLFRRR